jgi:hypothetical protein
MKNFLKKYFLLVADNPFRIAAWLIFVPAVVILLVLIFIFAGGTVLDAAVNIVVTFAFYGYISLVAVNIIVPLIFITHFPKSDKRLVLIRVDSGLVKSLLYQRPIWGKAPYVKIYFPEDWNLNDESLVREMTLKVVVPVINQSLCYVKFRACFSFGLGGFQASNLEEIIRLQGINRQHDKTFSFQSCLQRIIARKLGDNREVLRDWLLEWREKAITTKELEQKLLQLDLLSQNLFANIDSIELRLFPSDFTTKKISS